MTHLLRPSQNILVLREDETLESLALRFNVTDRGLWNILHGRTESPYRDRENAFANDVYKQKTPPWPQVIEDACGQHRSCERKAKTNKAIWKEFERSMQWFVEGRKFSKATLGDTVIAYSYLSKLHFGLMAPDLSPEQRCTPSPEQLNTFDTVADRLLSFLEPRKEELWAQLLCFNVENNQRGLLWEATPEDQRVQLKDSFEQAKFYEKMTEYLDLYEWDCEAAHNVLCYASRLGLTVHFSELRERLRVARGGVEPNYADTGEFDSDFDRFRVWLKEEQKREANLALSGGLNSNDGSKPPSPLPIGFEP